MSFPICDSSKFKWNMIWYRVDNSYIQDIFLLDPLYPVMIEHWLSVFLIASQFSVHNFILAAIIYTQLSGKKSQGTWNQGWA